MYIVCMLTVAEKYPIESYQLGGSDQSILVAVVSAMIVLQCIHVGVMSTSVVEAHSRVVIDAGFAGITDWKHQLMEPKVVALHPFLRQTHLLVTLSVELPLPLVRQYVPRRCSMAVRSGGAACP